MSTDYGKFNGWENWQPNYINGNTLWLDGKDESNFLLTGSTDITIWYDKSGMGNNATQIISGNTPTYNSSNKSVAYSTGDYLDLYDINCSSIRSTIRSCYINIICIKISIFQIPISI